jgi:hypothetical protein
MEGQMCRTGSSLGYLGKKNQIIVFEAVTNNSLENLLTFHFLSKIMRSYFGWKATIVLRNGQPDCSL